MKPRTFFLRDDLRQAWHGKDVFALLADLQGEIFRDKEGRRTLRFNIGDQAYFLKYHAGIGWAEIIKNLLQLRMPIISARNEWQAILKLHQLGIGTMELAGFGQRGWNPAKTASFVITDELTDTMSLEHLGAQWQQSPPDFQSKQALLRKLAEVSRDMHQAGINHRDYYLCHFLLDKSFADSNCFEQDTPLYLIDLHRTQQRRSVPERWLVKDLGSLLFSAHEVKLTSRDFYRFIQIYSGLSLRDALDKQGGFWRKVEKRANALLAKWHKQQAR